MAADKLDTLRARMWDKQQAISDLSRQAQRTKCELDTAYRCGKGEVAEYLRATYDTVRKALQLEESRYRSLCDQVAEAEMMAAAGR